MVVIGFIAWLVRLEGKATAALASHDKLEIVTDKLWNDIEKHKENQDIHFNQRMSALVEKGNTVRFETIEHQLTEINRKLDQIANRE